MTASRRPIDHGERATCAAAVTRVGANPGTPAPIAALAADVCQVGVALDAARRANDVGSCEASVTTDAKNAAETAFAAALHRWLYTAFAAHGRRVVSREVRSWMADRSPSRWLELAPRTRLADLPGLLLFARDLGGADAAIDGLDAAGRALTDAVSAWELALSRHSITSRAAEAAIRTFDRRYGVLVRAALAVDPDGVGAVLPTFHRRARPGAIAATASTGDVPEQPANPSAAASPLNEHGSIGGAEATSSEDGAHEHRASSPDDPHADAGVSTPSTTSSSTGPAPRRGKRGRRRGARREARRRGARSARQ